jgi:hypothetical protein
MLEGAISFLDDRSCRSHPWFNNRRLLEPIGYVPPVEYEAMYNQQPLAPAMVAGVK